MLDEVEDLLERLILCGGVSNVMGFIIRHDLTDVRCEVYADLLLETRRVVTDRALATSSSLPATYMVAGLYVSRPIRRR